MQIPDIHSQRNVLKMMCGIWSEIWWDEQLNYRKLSSLSRSKDSNECERLGDWMCRGCEHVPRTHSQRRVQINSMIYVEHERKICAIIATTTTVTTYRSYVSAATIRPVWVSWCFFFHFGSPCLAFVKMHNQIRFDVVAVRLVFYYRLRKSI